MNTVSVRYRSFTSSASVDEFKLEDEFVKKQAAKSDAAIVVIGRSSGEDRDTKLVDGSWFLTKDEKRLLEQVTREFKKVLVVVNSGGFIDFKWLDNFHGAAEVSDLYTTGDVAPESRFFFQMTE